MGRFDERIAHLRRLLGQAEEDQGRYRSGDRLWFGGREVTEARRERSERNTNLWRSLIDAYLKRDA
jgi:hypothetical protein